MLVLTGTWVLRRDDLLDRPRDPSSFCFYPCRWHDDPLTGDCDRDPDCQTRHQNGTRPTTTLDWQTGETLVKGEIVGHSGKLVAPTVS